MLILQKKAQMLNFSTVNMPFDLVDLFPPVASKSSFLYENHLAEFCNLLEIDNNIKKIIINQLY